jgi:fructose-1,6-bisphosphatase/inositol monophosphatase family enzyme
VTAAVTGESDARDPRKLCDLACAVAQEAAELLLSSAGQAAVVQTKSSPTDVVTEMDRAAEELIRDRIRSARPEDAILGEEGGETGAGAAVRWIVDPLDGTVNYLYGLPDWSVSIAAEVDGVVTAGAVCAPFRRSLYSATLGGGAWLQSAWLTGRQRLTCNTGVALAGALVATGFGYSASQRASQGRVVAALLPQVRDIRRAGSAALDLCSVASGRVDGYYERGVRYWDIAAGGIIASEAGALVGGLHGDEPSPVMTIAAAPALFTQLHDLLVRLDSGNPA